MGWVAGVYECGSVFGLCMPISGCLGVEKRHHGSVQATYVGFKVY